MTLVVFLTYGTSLDDWKNAGLLTREIKLYKKLSNLGWEIILVTYGDETDKAISLPENITIVPLFDGWVRPQNRVLRFILSLFILFVIRAKIPKHAVLKCKQMYGAWFPAILCFLSGRKFLFRYGFDDIHFRSNLGKKSFYELINKWLVLWSLKRASSVIVTTKNDLVRFREHVPRYNNGIYVIPNWVDVNEFRPRNNLVNPHRILFIGRLVTQKNLEKLISALNGSNFGIDLYGKGPLRQTLVQQAKLFGVDLKIYDPVSHEELPYIFNQYKLFCLPSLFEGNPKVLLEAMASGNIVLGTEVEGIKELIQHKQNGILLKPDLSDLHSNLEMIISDKQLQSLVSKNAVEYIKKFHCFEYLAKREHELLTSML